MLLDTHMTTQPVPTEKIDRLMGAPRRGMPPMLRTLVNAIEGARKDGETTVTPWAIDYRSYQRPELNRFFATEPQLLAT